MALVFALLIALFPSIQGWHVQRHLAQRRVALVQRSSSGSAETTEANLRLTSADLAEFRELIAVSPCCVAAERTKDATLINQVKLFATWCLLKYLST